MVQKIWHTILCTCSHKKQNLDHNKTGTNKTYIPVHETNNQVFSGHSTFLRNIFNLVVMKKCSNIYWITKLHQLKSIDSQISSVSQCSVKSSSEVVTSVLKFIYKQIKTCNS